MIRRLIAAVALVTATAAIPQALTLTNLKAPIAKICGQKPATSIAALWKQIAACQPSPMPTATVAPVPIPTAVPAPTPSPTRTRGTPVAAPITDAMRAALLGPGYDRGGGNRIPGTAAPDNLGAFRMICSPGPINWDDAIVYPGKIGGSPHPHQNYGNKLISGTSTHESLLAAGESTCSNELNRSAYWVPALITGDGKNVIRADWVSLYYKRLPASDPSCLKIAIKGCVGLPTGLRVLSGFDMKRMHEAQPENQTFSHRCTVDGKPSIHRATITEAIADCGGSGTVISSVVFHTCWNGQLDSPDHREHLAPRVWNNGEGHNAPWPGVCPSTHPYLVPELNQSVSYTIAASDGLVYFSSDRMAGMTPMPAGSTFHADYIEAWDLKTRQTWETHCLNTMLSCSDGEIGDGTMLRRPVQTYKAEPRLVPVPPRPTS